jgi:hypothetical protein
MFPFTLITTLELFTSQRYNFNYTVSNIAGPFRAIQNKKKIEY